MKVIGNTKIIWKKENPMNSNSFFQCTRLWEAETYIFADCIVELSNGKKQYWRKVSSEDYFKELGEELNSIKVLSLYELNSACLTNKLNNIWEQIY